MKDKGKTATPPKHGLTVVDHDGRLISRALIEGTIERRAEFEQVCREYSAARALLAALVECENALADYIPKMERRGDIMGYGHKVLTQARAAIARAKGNA